MRFVDNQPAKVRNGSLGIERWIRDMIAAWLSTGSYELNKSCPNPNQQLFIHPKTRHLSTKQQGENFVASPRYIYIYFLCALIRWIEFDGHGRVFRYADSRLGDLVNSPVYPFGRLRVFSDGNVCFFLGGISLVKVKIEDTGWAPYHLYMGS